MFCAVFSVAGIPTAQEQPSGSITSGVGLMSGLNIDDIVTKLMAIEKQPVTNLQNRLQTTDSQQAAITGLMAQVLGLKTALVPLKNNSFFRAHTVNSSNTSVLQATANSAGSGRHLPVSRPADRHGPAARQQGRIRPEPQQSR